MTQGPERTAGYYRLGLAIRLSKRSRGLLNAYRTLAPRRSAWFGEHSFDYDNAEAILLSLSMELALKAWWVFDFDQRDPPKTHDLEKLFNALTAESREKLRKAFVRDILPSDRDLWMTNLDEETQFLMLDSFLSYNKNAFVDWRYSHEKESLSMTVSKFEDTLDMILSEFAKRYTEREIRPKRTVFD